MGKDKLKRFEEIKAFSNVLEAPAMETYAKKGKWHQDIFKNNNPIVLELGCGKGEYSVGLARMHPNKNFVGVDIKGNRIYIGAKESLNEGLENVMFLRTRIDFIDNFFDTDEIDEIWLTFSDPQPKKPRKRLSSKPFINRYKKFLKKNGKIHVKTDSDLLFEFTEEEIHNEKYNCHTLTWNLYGEKYFGQLSEEEKKTFEIRTHYEKLFSSKGSVIKYCCFSV